MGKILIVARVQEYASYKELAKKYHLGFEVNDFYNPEILENKEKLNQLISFYQKNGLPDDSTMHGAFFDTVLFSYDSRIREISELRMEESMKIAVRLGVRAVVFHTNYLPILSGKEYDMRAIMMTVEFMECLLSRYPDTDIYIENMFDTDPVILKSISKKLSKYANYGVCFDYAHASISPTPIEIWLRELQPYIRHIHINDNDLKRDQHLAVGDGKIDWGQFMIFKNEYFHDCSILIETNDPNDQERSLQYLQENFVDFIK